MRTWRRRLAAGALALAVAATTGMTGTTVGSAGDQAQPAGPGGPGKTVTLITGDRVELRGSRLPAAYAGPGRAGMGFRITKERGDTYVLPYDALAPVSAGRVDRRLFNVTRLAELGYDDRSRKDIPLIVAGGSEKVRAVKAAQVTRELRSVGAVAVSEPKDRAAEFWKGVRGSAKGALAAGVDRVWLDGKVKATLDRSVPQVGAPAAWQAGHTGAGTKVAVLDTGIDTTHADLSDAVVGEQDFTGSESGADDRDGHGTHVASTIGGSGTASNRSYRGVAPDTTLLNGKVLDDGGSGHESWILAGMEWAVAQGADVVNMSLGSGFPADGTSPMEQAINRLTGSGTLFVVAAGNSGPGSGTISSPAAADAALAVGAVDKSDQLADFSSRGPRPDGAVKPEITAPGVGIVAARAQHATGGEPVGTGYSRLSGTSMAAPHVAGAAAILVGQHPDWTAGQLKAALVGSAQPHSDLSVYEQGAGRVDVARATTQQVRTSVGSVNLGTARWPHDDDQPITRTVTYHNDGDQPITLTLSTDVNDPTGAAAPAGMFTVSASSLTVPAHGSASAGLVATPSIDGPDGTYSGALVASTGATRLRTLVGLNREVESYDLTIRTVDWDGHTASPEVLQIVNVDKPDSYLLFNPAGVKVVRLPKGRYYYDSYLYKVESGPPARESVVHFVEPDIALTKTISLTMDARDAVPIGFRTDNPEAAMAEYAIDSWRDTAWGGKDHAGFRWMNGDNPVPVILDHRVRPSRTSAPGAYHFDLEGLLARPDGNGGYTGSPYQYHLKWSEDGKVPADIIRRIHDDDLAEVRTRIAAQVPGEMVFKDWIAGTAAPGTIVERYSPGFEFWPGHVRQSNDQWGESYTLQAAISPKFFLKKGKAGTERWNVGPLMPAQDHDHSSHRAGDEMLVSLSMYSDQNRDHVGSSIIDSGSTRLLREGVEVASEPSAGSLYTEVPGEPATYRLETEAVRSNSPFTTRQSAAWTFRSGTTTEETPLPLMMIRFAPKLDDLNQAPAGVPYAVPVNIQVQDGAPRGTITSLTVDVSYDDGATWKPAKVDGRTALVEHPRRARFVSLRATATDSVGNKAEQTVIHAYGLRQ